MVITSWYSYLCYKKQLVISEFLKSMYNKIAILIIHHFKVFLRAIFLN